MASVPLWYDTSLSTGSTRPHKHIAARSLGPSIPLLPVALFASLGLPVSGHTVPTM